MPNSLTAHALSCYRGGRPVFDNLSLAAEAGELVQISGPNGSGKTSLLRILAGLAAPESGTVEWCGRALERGPQDAFRRARCYVGHKTAVAGDLSALENLAFACELQGTRTDGGKPRDPRAALAQLGLRTRLEQPARKLSAGQRQRIALARLLVTDAALWLLDEPFTALDRDGKQCIETMLHEHCDNGGIAVVATHQRIDIETPALKTVALAGNDLD